MANLRRPTRDFSFADHQRSSPSSPPPGNELDGAFRDMREAIISTQEALAEIRRDDGQLRNQVVGPEQLKPGLVTNITGDVTKITDLLTNSVRSAIATHQITASDISLLAKDAEAAATSAGQWLSQIKAIEQRLLAATRSSEITALALDTTATDTENWYNAAKAQADNATKAKEEALAWSEYLAGPVVSGPDAPAYIEHSPFPQGLYYQPVQGWGGIGGLWSAKWWAIWCWQLVGWIGSLYLGAWDHHPSPGEVSSTGQVVPNPIIPGSMYFNTVDHNLYIWTGDYWIKPFSLTGGVISRFNYLATAGQTVFTGPDMHGLTPGFEADTEHDVHLNGIKLVRDEDYEITGLDTLTLLFPVTANSVVQWDNLVSADDLRPGAAVIFKIDPISPDGVTTVFTLTYMSATQSPYITKPEELWVSVDGVVQEPRVEYSASGDKLTMFTAPSATSKMWAVYFRSGDLTALEPREDPAPVITMSETRVLENATVGTTVGLLSVINPHTGTPTYGLTDNAGGKFAVVGNSIQVAAALDFETATSHNITVEALGISPSASPRTFTITVLDVTEGTIGQIILAGNTVSEDAIIGQTIGVLSVIGATGTPLFTLLDNAGGKFFVSGNSLRVASSTLDYETASSHLILVAVTGVLPVTANRLFTINVTPVSGAIGHIMLSASTVSEDAVVNTTIGILSTAGTTGSPVFILTDSSGGKFKISGNQLQVAALLDYETAPTHAITIAVAGVSPATAAETFAITVTYVDTTAPTITSPSIAANVENTILAHALTANESVTWSIVGGADAARFEISGSTLRWNGNTTRDYEAPADADANNQYIVQVRATDLVGLTTNQTITVTVTDVSEVSFGLTFAGGTNTNITLSDANLSIAPSSNALGMAIASLGYKRSGKHYFEVVHADVGVNGEGAGIAAEGADINKVATANYPTHAMFVSSTDGRIGGKGITIYPGASIGSVITVGDRICFAVDLDNFRFWARKGAAGNWNNNAAANPATNVGGIDIAYFSQTRLAPMGMFFAGSQAASAKWTYNFGATAFTGAVPAGFNAGWNNAIESALGHPTYAYWKTIVNAVMAIDKGDRLAAAMPSGNDMIHVGLSNFKSTGKYYVEFQQSNTQAPSDGIGFMTHDATVANVMTNGSNCGVLYVNSGNIWGNNVNSGRTLGTGRARDDIIGAAIDLDNDKVWFRVAPSGNWNGRTIDLEDPALNIGGVSISLFNAKALGPVYTTNSNQIGYTLNAGQRTFNGNVPIGFTAGWPLNPADTTTPTITSSSSVNIGELVPLVHTLTANEVVSWTIQGGTDAAKFELVNSNTLRWLNDDVKDYEAPDDSNADRVYQVVVRATDLSSNTTDQTISFTVTDTIYEASFLGGTNTNITLSQGSLTIAGGAGVTAMAIASAAWKNTGKFYFEILNVVVGSANDGFGLAAEGASLAKIIDFSYTLNALFIRNTTGGIAARGYSSTNPIAQIGALAAGDWCCVAVDFDNWRFWARKGATGQWNGNASANPATGVGAINIDYFSQTRLAPFGVFNNSGGGKVRYNLGAGPFVGAVPSGFTPGWSTGAQAATGHPTYAYLSTQLSTPAIIEQGGRLSLFGKSPYDDVLHVGSSNFKNSGKYYVEFTQVTGGSAANHLGFVTNDVTLANIDVHANLSMMGSFGDIWSNDVATGKQLSGVVDDSIIGAAIDLDNDKVWFRVAPSGNWNGQAIGLQDPATNTGGVSISNYAAKTMGPAIMINGIATYRAIINTGHYPFLGAVPAGFIAGWPKT